MSDRKQRRARLWKWGISPPRDDWAKYVAGAENISIILEFSRVSICRPCCSLTGTGVTFLTTTRDSWNLPASPSPSPHLTAKTDVSHLRRPLSAGARASYLSAPIREGEEGKRMLHLGKRRVAGSRAAAPGSCCCSAVVATRPQNHTHAVVVLDPRRLFPPAKTAICRTLYVPKATQQWLFFINIVVVIVVIGAE